MIKYLLIPFIFLPQMALAGFTMNPSLGMYKKDGNNSLSQLELRLGYQFDMGLYLGGFYALGSQKWIDAADDYYLGVHVGYDWKGVYGLLGYVVTGDQDLKSGGTKYSGAKGVSLTVGYRLLLAEEVYLGPELTYRTVKFDDREIQGLAAPTDRQDDLLVPAIALTFKF